MGRSRVFLPGDATPDGACVARSAQGARLRIGMRRRARRKTQNGRGGGRHARLHARGFQIVIHSTYGPGPGPPRPAMSHATIQQKGCRPGPHPHHPPHPRPRRRRIARRPLGTHTHARPAMTKVSAPPQELRAGPVRVREALRQAKPVQGSERRSAPRTRTGPAHNSPACSSPADAPITTGTRSGVPRPQQASSGPCHFHSELTPRQQRPRSTHHRAPAPNALWGAVLPVRHCAGDQRPRA